MTDAEIDARIEIAKLSAVSEAREAANKARNQALRILGFVVVVLSIGGTLGANAAIRKLVVKAMEGSAVKQFEKEAADAAESASGSAWVASMAAHGAEGYLERAQKAAMEAESLASVLPIGSIIAWHKNPWAKPDGSDPGPSLDLNPDPGAVLPDRWVECNGRADRDDPATPFDETRIPDLNGSGRFLRGEATSGTLQVDTFKAHDHGPTNGTYFLSVTDNVEEKKQGIPHKTGTQGFSVANATGRRGGDETRPKNMSVVWIIRVK